MRNGNFAGKCDQYLPRGDLYGTAFLHMVCQSRNRASGMADGFTAVKQAVEILFSVERFLWQIYSPNFGMEWEGLVGQNPGYVALEIQRRAKDAIRTDRRMTEITDFSYQVNGDSLTVEFTVQTVYGPVPQRITV